MFNNFFNTLDEETKLELLDLLKVYSASGKTLIKFLSKSNVKKLGWLAVDFAKCMSDDEEYVQKVEDYLIG